MTVDLTTVKAGDKLHTRQGDVLVVYDSGVLATSLAFLDAWTVNGEWLKQCTTPHRNDIIRIEKHEPVVEEYWVAPSDMHDSVVVASERAYTDEPIYKITITDGVPSIEKVGE